MKLKNRRDKRRILNVYIFILLPLVVMYLYCYLIYLFSLVGAALGFVGEHEG